MRGSRGGGHRPPPPGARGEESTNLIPIDTAGVCPGRAVSADHFAPSTRMTYTEALTEVRVVRYATGVTPAHLLKALVKWVASEYPAS